MVVLLTIVMTERLGCVCMRACVCVRASACLFVVVHSNSVANMLDTLAHTQCLHACVCVCVLYARACVCLCNETQETPERCQKLITFRSMQYEGKIH